MPTAKKISEIYQPIKGVPVLQCEKSFYCLDMTGTVWKKTSTKTGNVETVTIEGTFTQGAKFTWTGTKQDVTGGKQVTPTSWELSEVEE